MTAREQILQLTRRNYYYIRMAIANIGCADDDYGMILSEIHRMRSTHIPARVQDRRLIPMSPPRFQPGPEMPGDRVESFLTDQSELI